jgi:hypothetical protein
MHSRRTQPVCLSVHALSYFFPPAKENSLGALFQPVHSPCAIAALFRPLDFDNRCKVNILRTLAQKHRGVGKSEAQTKQALLLQTPRHNSAKSPGTGFASRFFPFPYSFTRPSLWQGTSALPSYFSGDPLMLVSPLRKKAPATCGGLLAAARDLSPYFQMAPPAEASPRSSAGPGLVRPLRRAQSAAL